MKQHQKIFEDMLSSRKHLFARFKQLNDDYAQNPDRVKEEFNRVGEEVLGLIRHYENILCGATEHSQYSKFSSSLSEKFWSQIRTVFPKIDFVGVE